jgi:hypothetical protein
MRDRREEFADVPWQQGRMLYTQITMRWSVEEKEKTQKAERCRVFAYFSATDEGRSRELLLVCETPRQARDIVNSHNTKLRKKNAKRLQTPEGC